MQLSQSISQRATRFKTSKSNFRIFIVFCLEWVGWQVLYILYIISACLSLSWILYGFFFFFPFPRLININHGTESYEPFWFMSRYYFKEPTLRIQSMNTSMGSRAGWVVMRRKGCLRLKTSPRPVTIPWRIHLHK